MLRTEQTHQLSLGDPLKKRMTVQRPHHPLVHGHDICDGVDEPLHRRERGMVARMNAEEMRHGSGHTWSRVT